MDRNNQKRKRKRRRRRKLHIRRKVSGTANRPRLSVFRSNKHIYGQLIDDEAGRTLASASSLDNEARESLQGAESLQGRSGDWGADRKAAEYVGTLLAERAKAAGVEACVFDRNGYKFHGRVKHLADAAREGGLKS